MSDHLWSTIFSVIVYWRLLFNPSFTVSGVGESGYILWRYILQYLLVVCIGCHEKHDYANYDQFAQKFEMAYKTILLVSVPNLKLFGSMKTELWAKEVREFSVMLYGKMGWWAFFCPPTWLPQYKCIEIF